MGEDPSFGRDVSPTIAPPTTMVILHSLSGSVEQLCARSPDAPSLESLRPKSCACCGELARNSDGVLQVVGHGLYARQVCGLVETGWIVIWVRRFLCRGCGHTMSRLPDWLHPWRWYAATVIIEALYRHCWLGEAAGSIGVRFGRPKEALGWQSLRRWRAQLLVSPTLWGWLGPRLGVVNSAVNRGEGRAYVLRLLAEGGHWVQSGAEFTRALVTTVRRTFENLIHNRKQAWRLEQFPPGAVWSSGPERNRPSLPTEKDSGAKPP